jgi:hypothetical protein
MLKVQKAPKALAWHVSRDIWYRPLAGYAITVYARAITRLGGVYYHI